MSKDPGQLRAPHRVVASGGEGSATGLGTTPAHSVPRRPRARPTGRARGKWNLRHLHSRVKPTAPGDPANGGRTHKQFTPARTAMPQTDSHIWGGTGQGSVYTPQTLRTPLRPPSSPVYGATPATETRAQLQNTWDTSTWELRESPRESPRPVSHRVLEHVHAYAEQSERESGRFSATSSTSGYFVPMSSMHPERRRPQPYLAKGASFKSYGSSGSANTLRRSARRRHRGMAPAAAVAELSEHSRVMARSLSRGSSIAPKAPDGRGYSKEEIRMSMKELLKEHRLNLSMGARPARTEPLTLRRSAAEVNKLHGRLFDHMQNPREWAAFTSTDYSRRELIALFIRFKALCALSPSPHGLDLETFRRGTPALSVEDNFFSERVFAVLDRDCKGVIGFKEYLQGVHVLQRGSRQDLLKFLFAVHDENMDGELSKQELFRFFLASLRVSVNENIEQMSVSFVDNVFNLLDKEGKGVIKLNDALQYLHDNPDQTDVFGLFGRTMTFSQDPVHGGRIPALPDIDAGFTTAEIDEETERAYIGRMAFALTHQAGNAAALRATQASNGGSSDGAGSGTGEGGDTIAPLAAMRKPQRGLGQHLRKHSRKYLGTLPSFRRRKDTVAHRVDAVLRSAVTGSGVGDDSDDDGEVVTFSQAEIGSTALKTMMNLGMLSEGQTTARDALLGSK